MHYQNVIEVLENKTIKVVEDVNNTEIKIKTDLNDLKDMLETYKKFKVQWGKLRNIIMDEEANRSLTLMEKVQQLKFVDREKEKLATEFEVLKKKIGGVQNKMGRLCPACKSVFEEVQLFIKTTEMDGSLIKMSDKFPPMKYKKQISHCDFKTPVSDKSVQVNIAMQKPNSFKTKVAKLAKNFDIVLT